MKNLTHASIAFLLSTLLTTSIYSQQIIECELYKVVYSEVYQQPLSLSYSYPSIFLAESVQMVANAELTPFLRLRVKEEVSFPSSEKVEIIKSKVFRVPSGSIVTSNDDDYVDNDYDKGHLAPNKSFKNIPTVQDYLWSYLNCALMHETLNGGVWSTLEEYERTLRYSDTLNVRVNVIMSFSDKSEMVQGGATVPTHFTKIIEYGFDGWSNTLDNYTREVYTFPNDDTVRGRDISEFKVERLSGKFEGFE